MAKAKKTRKAKAAKTRPAKSAVKSRIAVSKAAKPKAKAKSAVKKPAARRPQTFTVSHHREEDFDQGLRTYAKYRDLGIAPATGGMVQAHVIRFIPPYRAEDVSTPHFHDVEFQMIYVLKGWYKAEFEGEGEHTFEAGSCWIQPPRIVHAVLGYSDDCELLEIVLPADFETVTLP